MASLSWFLLCCLATDAYRCFVVRVLLLVLLLLEFDEVSFPTLVNALHETANRRKRRRRRNTNTSGKGASWRLLLGIIVIE